MHMKGMSKEIAKKKKISRVRKQTLYGQLIYMIKDQNQGKKNKINKIYWELYISGPSLLNYMYFFIYFNLLLFIHGFKGLNFSYEKVQAIYFVKHKYIKCQNFYGYCS